MTQPIVIHCRAKTIGGVKQWILSTSFNEASAFFTLNQTFEDGFGWASFLIGSHVFIRCNDVGLTFDIYGYGNWHMNTCQPLEESEEDEENKHVWIQI